MQTVQENLRLFVYVEEVNYMKIGLVIADIYEFMPIEKIVKQGNGEIINLLGDKCALFTIESGNKSAQVYAVLCGIGKVNAAAATANLINLGCETIINSGLSGAIDVLKPGDFTVGTKYIEHDFDLTPLGYKKYEKPLQEYIYNADDSLVKIFTEMGLMPGVMAAGDSFICCNIKNQELKTNLKAISCDMESAACAAICAKAKVKFAAVRKISDGADDDATKTYKELNEQALPDLVDIVINGIKILINQ